MLAKPLAFLLADLGVTKSHSRPYTSNDNPFSEAQFKTMKYRPDYPDRFGSLLEARDWGQHFFHWYNFEHHHTALGLLTPADVHFGRAAEVLQQRQLVLQQAYDRHPERFVRGLPHPRRCPRRSGSTRPSRSSHEPNAFRPNHFIRDSSARRPGSLSRAAERSAAVAQRCERSEHP